MNTSAGYYQAPRQPRVPLDEVLIKLHPEGFHQEFEADGINVGAGGLSMRASVLPEVGSTLRCQLDNPTGGEAIEMIGRVVWAHENGPHIGEFGIRFTHLSDRDQNQIEALIQQWGRTSAKAPVVQLQLDGVDSAIMAEVQSETNESLSVEQPLPFLAIGGGVLNESSGRRGHLEAVELKMDEETPKLVLSIGYEVEDPSDASGDDEEDRDTVPEDMPPAVQQKPRIREERMHDTPRIVRYDATEEQARESIGERLRAYAKSSRDQLASAAGGARSALADGLLPGIASYVKELFALAGRFIGALRSRLDDDKPRRRQVPRSEAARAHLKNTRRGGRRYLILVAMISGIVAAGWGIYLWAAAGSAESGSEPVTEADSEAAAGSETEVSAEGAAAAPTATIPALETATADASAEAYEPQGAPLPPENVRGTAFGADSVAGGEKYVLRMSNPVAAMEGIVEGDGFSVTIPGSLSLSRAGPIATAHPDIEHASILNRGDFSELTVRFVAGRHPAYRVEARGPAIEITVAR
ncbi:MAG: PilZ domain-containing protein [Polyangiales bacterium]